MAQDPARTAVLALGLRSPQAKAGGAFAKEDAGHLGATVAREVLARSGVGVGEIEEVIVGCVGPPHDQANVARVVALRAGVPKEVPAFTVARNCASGMEALSQAVLRIEAGVGSCYLAVGVEVMSQYPLIVGREMTAFFDRLSRSRSVGEKLATFASFRPRFLAPRIALLEGLTDPTCGLIMGKTAEILGREFAISRRDADEYALRSHQLAAKARDAGRFAREILPLLPLGAKDGASSLEHDDGIRDTQTMEALAKLKPYFEKPDGIVTVGNACGITDGATALLVTSEARAKSLGLKPLARIRAVTFAGLDPSRMGLGPVYSSAKALQRVGVTLADVGPIEINEAFAVQVLACAKAFASKQFAERELGLGAALGELDFARTNANGGAIALGHPVGASGARIVLTAAHELATSDRAFALATLCIGGGQGGATVLEKLA
ncbi:MAG: acetyl-CoA C-acyltransferase [Planctomycetes bacterium]|nr:acetyl-CoA C-acyltransferase [Planctomycetota bacterium]